jgi:hypothetical protein
LVEYDVETRFGLYNAKKMKKTASRLTFVPFKN